ncbi:MAG: hypothetical protein KGJ84_14555 [Elusimicrobia bacterium]|nr:hypothetical protein [Elusimicrobiota bacterium]
MPSVWLLALLLAARASASPAEQGWDWRETSTPHFIVRHQDTWLPPGLTIGIERIHFRLGMDLGTFSPWMAKDKINLYLYRDLQSYVAGEFSPPPWSNGVAIYDKKAVAIPSMATTPQMLRVLAHETTHLLFVSYFQEKHVQPPSWVNEGLAMLEEADSPERPQTSQWYQSMVAMDPAKWFPIDDFLEINPTKDLHDNKTKVAEWYVQAYSMMNFLVRKHSRLQFKNFCSLLRDGKTSEEALMLAYRFRSTADFNHQWRNWLNDPMHKRRVEALSDADRAQGDGVINKAARGSSPFHAFSSGWEVTPRMVFPSSNTGQSRDR